MRNSCSIDYPFILSLGILSETEHKPNKPKINKNTRLFDLLPPDLIKTTNKMIGTIIHWENFSTFLAQINQNIIPLLRNNLNNNWNLFGPFSPHQLILFKWSNRTLPIWAGLAQMIKNIQNSVDYN